MGVKQKISGMVHNFTHNPSFTLKEQLGYAGGMFGNAMGQDCVYTYSSKFNRDYQMIPTDKLTVMEMASRFLGFFVPPVAGALLDLPVREGKKSVTKRILKLTPLPFAITSMLLFVVPSGSWLMNTVWAFVLTLLFETVDTFFDMSLSTLSLRMTTNPADRKNFYTLSSLATTLGSMLPGWLLPIVVEKFATANEQKWAHFFVALAFCILGVLTMIAPYFTLNEKVGNLKVHNEEKIIWDRNTLGAIMHNKPFMVMMIATVFETVRQVTYDLLPDLYKETFDNYGMKAGVDVISGMLSYVGLFAVPFVGKKVSARTMVMGGHLYSTLFYAAAAMLGVNFNLERVRKTRWVTGVLIGLSGMPNSGMGAGRKILLADSTDYMEWYTEKKYGHPVRSDGMLLAAQSIIGKLNSLLRVFIKNTSLTAIGYQSGRQDETGNAIDVVQTEGTLKGIYFVVTLCGVIGNFLPAIIYSFDSFTGKRRNAIMDELAEMREKRAGTENQDRTQTVLNGERMNDE
ncbi:MAG: MFS transporter [Clostridia bacterium]|nr:MFS transporter [Clostridia bacterium]